VLVSISKLERPPGCAPRPSGEKLSRIKRLVRRNGLCTPSAKAPPSQHRANAGIAERNLYALRKRVYTPLRICAVNTRRTAAGRYTKHSASRKSVAAFGLKYAVLIAVNALTARRRREVIRAHIQAHRERIPGCKVEVGSDFKARKKQWRSVHDRIRCFDSTTSRRCPGFTAGEPGRRSERSLDMLQLPSGCGVRGPTKWPDARLGDQHFRSREVMRDLRAHTSDLTLWTIFRPSANACAIIRYVPRKS